MVSTFVRDWKEAYIDHMGLIVALSGERRMDEMRLFKRNMERLTLKQQGELRLALALRFTPTNGQDGCQSGMQAVREA